jgi:stalled ribosome rescue protein Dom34
MRQTAIWIDQHEARIFHVETRTFDKDTIHAANHHVQRHPKDQETKIRNHPNDEGRFFDEVLALLAGSEELLLMGPSVTKLHFLRYAERKAPALAARVVGIETADHPTDRELVAHIRHYFHEDAPRLGVAR